MPPTLVGWLSYALSNSARQHSRFSPWASFLLFFVKCTAGDVFLEEKEGAF